MDAGENRMSAVRLRGLTPGFKGSGTPPHRAVSATRLGLVAVLIGLLQATGVTAAVADEGLDVRSSSRYVVDTKAARVRATMKITLRNELPDQGLTYYYWDSFKLALPVGAKKIVATSGGGALSTSTQALPDEPSRTLLTISFGALRYGNTRTIELSFELPAAKPRAVDQTRVGPDHASLEVFGPGDPGQMKVVVVLPKDWTHDSTSTDFTATTKGSTTVLEATADNLDPGFWALVSARSPEEAKGLPLTLGATTLDLVPYSDDAAWGRFVAQQLRVGLPALEKLVGAPWPAEIRTIREDTSVTVLGFDGWYDQSEGEIVLSEELDATLLFHELAHAWSASDTFADRWMSEGMAELLADRAVRATGGTPSHRPKVTPASTGHLPLAEWGENSDGRSGESDAYAYPASFQVMQALFKGADETEFTAIVHKAIEGQSAYAVAAPDDVATSDTTWQRLLDLVEAGGGSEDGPALMQRWVLTKADKAALAGRPAARSAYAALDRENGQWLPPLGVRQAMTDWNWSAAQVAVKETEALSAGAVSVQQAAEQARMDLPATLRREYEGAAGSGTYATLATRLPEMATAVRSVGAARDAAAADRNPMAAFGESVQGVDGLAAEGASDLAAGDLAGAIESAQAATERSERATLVGIGALVVVLLALVALALGGRALLRRRGERTAVLASTAPAPVPAFGAAWGAATSEDAQHPGVAEGVGLDPLQVEELGDPLVIAAQQLGVDVGSDRLALDRGEAVAGEEGRLEGEAEDARDPDGPRPVDQGLQEG